MRRRALQIACATLLTLGQSGVAAAQVGGAWVAHAEGNRVGVENDWWPTEPVQTLTWGVVGQIRLGAPVYLDFDVPWAAFFPDGGDARFVFGNPTVGAHWADKVTPDVVVFAGGTLTVPTLITDRSTIDQDTFEDYLLKAYAAATRAYLDIHRFLPDYLALRPRAGVEVRITPNLRYRGDLTPALFFPVGDGADDVEMILEHGSEIEGRSDAGLGGGLRLQGALIATELNGDDILQTAIEPYFMYDPDEGFYVRLGSLIALDENAGFGFDERKLATWRLSLGGKW